MLCFAVHPFTSDFSKTGELGIFNKGTWSEVQHLSRSRVYWTTSTRATSWTICPVGALLDRDFRYQVSVWYLKETQSICPAVPPAAIPHPLEH